MRKSSGGFCCLKGSLGSMHFKFAWKIHEVQDWGVLRLKRNEIRVWGFENKCWNVKKEHKNVFEGDGNWKFKAKNLIFLFIPRWS